LTNALSRESNPAPLKYTLSLLGLMSARLRLPLVEPTEATRCAVRAAVAAIDDRCPGYLIGGAGWLADMVRTAAE
jgi:dihydrodipicolinate synthase/N-acetylneuraminate lyase